MSSSPILAVHICAGTLGLLSGAAAMTIRKGSLRHGLAGNVFVVSMLTLSSSGVWIGMMKSQTTNVLMGILTFYLVTTAWSAARRGDGEAGILDWGALLLALAFGSVLLTYGVEAVRSSTGLKDGYPPPLYFIFGGVSLFSAAGDIRMLTRGGVFGANRIARHLWRMCLGFFIAAASFFLGQQRVFPASWRGSPVFYLPPALVLLFMIFWLLRVFFTNAFKGPALPSAPEDCREYREPRLPA